jgi:hypothetical protein
MLSTWKNGDQRVTSVTRVGMSRAEIFAEPPFALIRIIHLAHLDVRQITTTLSVCKGRGLVATKSTQRIGDPLSPPVAK